MSSYEVEEYYKEIIKGCPKVSPNDESLIKIVIELTLKLYRDKLKDDANDIERERVLMKG